MKLKTKSFTEKLLTRLREIEKAEVARYEKFSKCIDPRKTADWEYPINALIDCNIRLNQIQSLIHIIAKCRTEVVALSQLKLFISRLTEVLLDNRFAGKSTSPVHNAIDMCKTDIYAQLRRWFVEFVEDNPT